MNKDVIYIDVEDDITAIIGKVKAAKHKIVAVVPPARIGVLQSAVNLRLLDRAAQADDKRLVLITNNQALVALSAAAKIPVARTLQSKPEVAEVSALAVDDDDAIIDGAALPQTPTRPTNQAAGPNLADQPHPSATGREPLATPKAVAADGVPAKKATKPKVPNFSAFRKKLFLIGGGVLLLVCLVVWAVWFAPRATVVVSAKTTPLPLSSVATLDPNSATDASQRLLRPVIKRQERVLSADFTPTGSKEVGEKARGSVRLTRTSISSDPLSVPAGTTFTSGEYSFVSLESVTLEGTGINSGGLVQDSVSVKVQASKVGDEYNLSSRSYEASVRGINARGTDMSGGSKRTIQVVTAQDVARAADQLVDNDESSTKAALESSFDRDINVIKESYTTSKADPVSNPAIGQEASGSAKLTRKVIYSMVGVTKTDLNSYLDAMIAEDLKDSPDQRPYSNGQDKVFYSEFKAGNTTTVKLTTNASVGPKIDEREIRDRAKGKRLGDIQSDIESVSGVRDVDVKFWPFWVRTVPNDANKVRVEFKLENA